MLTMSTSFLPTSNCWANFLETANQTYDNMQDEMMDLVKSEAELSLMMIMDSSYKQVRVSRSDVRRCITAGRIHGSGTWTGRSPVGGPSRGGGWRRSTTRTRI